MKIPGFFGDSRMKAKERDALLNLIPQDGAFIEVGTFHGTTVAYWAKQRPDVHFISIDPFVGKASVSLWKKNQQPNQNLWVGTLATLRIPRFSEYLFFIDGDHNRDSVLSDLDQALLTAREIWVHDYTNKRLPGVREAIEHFVGTSAWIIDQVVETTAILKRR